MKVLIVDDDVLVCSGLRKLVPWDNLGFEVIGEARNGEDAFKIALLEHPDLIITDIRMPIMDGLEFCKKIYESMSDTSTILLSAHEDFEYARTALKFGVKSYILKPINEEKINALIDEIKQISDDLKNKKELYTAIYDDQLEKDIQKSLEVGDIDYINDLFETRLPAMSNTNNGIKELCIKLINIMYSYFETVGVNTGFLRESKERNIDDIINMKTTGSIISYTYQLFIDIIQFKAHKRDSHTDSIVEHIRSYLNLNYTDPNLSLATLADNLNITSTYISLIFKETVGINISSYITNLRIKKACDLLKDPAHKMYDIASMVGYLDVRYFARVFKRLKGVTPSEYRNANL